MPLKRRKDNKRQGNIVYCQAYTYLDGCKKLAIVFATSKYISQLLEYFIYVGLLIHVTVFSVVVIDQESYQLLHNLQGTRQRRWQ